MELLTLRETTAILTEIKLLRKISLYRKISRLVTPLKEEFKWIFSPKLTHIPEQH